MSTLVFSRDLTLSLTSPRAQMKKLSLREVKQLAQGHMRSKGQGSNLSGLFILLTTFSLHYVLGAAQA